jgi:hypothetical protein
LAEAIPGSSPIVGFSATSSTDYYLVAVLENGDVYTHALSGTWAPQGNLLCGTTAAKGITWGALKARYK